MSDDEPGRLADELDRDAGEMQKRSGKLAREIDDVGDDWERKRADPSVPGAPEDQSAEGDDENADAGQAAGNPPQGDTPGDRDSDDEDS